MNSGCRSAMSRSAWPTIAAMSPRWKTSVTGERYPLEWGGIRLRIDPVRDPALLFRCLA